MTKDIPRSGVSGVIWRPNEEKWIASINIDKKHYHLGTFKDLDEAVLKRYKAEQEMTRDLYIGYSPAHWYLINKGILKER